MRRCRGGHRYLMMSLFAGAAVLAGGAIAAPGPAGPATQPAAVAEAPASRPNIVLLLADDLGVEGINAYGGEYYTPNIDRLAREGVKFENAHATPLCTPTRVRMMTGRENAKSYQAFGYLDPTARTFAHVLKDAGYATAVVGKWQLTGNGYDGRIGATPQQAGFDESLLWQEKVLDAKGSRYWGPTLSRNGVNRIHEGGFGPDYQTDAALDFITRNKDRPFLLYVPFMLPHAPWVTTPDSPNAKTDKDRFAGMVSYMDGQVGRIVDKLAELKLDKNTIVIFTGDNGTGRPITTYRDGAAVKGEKGLPTVSGTHVALVAKWPGRFPAGATRTGLFDLMDITPTLAGFAGAPLAAEIDGVDQGPVITGEKSAARDWIFQHFAPVWIQEPARYVFDADWKLYGDGRFVAIDQARGVETPATPKPGSAGARRLAEFRQVLATRNDGPLDPARFPMCLGRASRKPGTPPEIAGCDRLDGPLE